MVHKISVLGSGAFGTAIAALIARNGHTVTLWCREEEVADEITSQRSNSRYLKGISLPEGIVASHILRDVVREAQIVLHAIPVAYLRSVLEQIPREYAAMLRVQAWVSLSKGIEDQTLMLPCDVISEVLGVPLQNIFAAGGPDFARELARGEFSGITLAGSREYDAAGYNRIIEVLAGPSCRVEHSRDIVGVQLAGVLKNVLALMVGILRGASVAENTIAYLACRGFVAASELMQACGGEIATLYGLAGFGDFVLTAFGTQSRNVRVGQRIGAGEKVADILAEIGTAPEGLQALPAVCEIARRQGVAREFFERLLRVVQAELPVRMLWE